MGATRPFIDVLVGKLTAYVDASSRPASDSSASIQTPWWVAALETVPVQAATAARAYAGQTPLPAASVTRSRRPAAVPIRTPAQLTAIQLLRRLGAEGINAHSTDSALRSACRQLVRSCHPDSHGTVSDADRAVLTGRLRAILRARDVLQLPAVRAGEADVECAAGTAVAA